MPPRAPGGTLDRAFGQDGTMVLGSGTRDTINAALGSPSGQVIAVGTTSVAEGSAFLLVRLTHDGALDPSFGEHGRVVTSVGAGHAEAWAAAWSADGRLVVVGSAGGGERADPDIALARYLPDGTLDPTFGRDGIVVHKVGTGADTAFAVAVDTRSRPLVAGQCGRPDPTANTRGTACIVRYQAGGGVDPTFGVEGVRRLPIGEEVESLRGIVVDERGGVVASGYRAYSTANELTLFRLSDDGRVDDDFGDLGSTTYRGRGFSDAFALSLQGDRILVAGFTADPDGSDKDVLLAGFSADGRLDPKFGDRGVTATPIGPGDDVAFALAAGSDAIVVAAYAFNGGHNDAAMARYSVDGALDRSFGDGGTLTVPVGSAALARGIVVHGPSATLVGEVKADDKRAALLARING